MSDEPDRLRVAAFTTSSLIAAAEGLGRFRAHGLAVEVEEVPSSGRQMDGLRDGRYDAVHTSPDNIMRERSRGLDAVVFLVLDTGLPQLLVGGRSIEGWSSVAGSRVGVDDPDSGFAFVVYELLRRHGIDHATCPIESVGSSRQRLDALASGEIDVGLLSEAMAGRLPELGLSVLTRASDELPWYPGVAVAATAATVDGRTDALGRYSLALREALEELSAPAGPSSSAVAAVAAGLERPEESSAALLAREAASRTSVAPSPAEAADALGRVAALREAYTGEVPTGYFDDRVMRSLGG